MEKLRRLLELPRLANARLDKVAEELIDDYIQQRRATVGSATVNRQLATLRRALRLAYKWKIIDRLPKIEMLQGERNREFVVTPDQERLYLECAPQPLSDIAIVLVDTRMRVGEVLVLEWPDLHFEPAPGARAGYIQIRVGKSKRARRNLSMTTRVRACLEARMGDATTKFVFASPAVERYPRDFGRPHAPEAPRYTKAVQGFCVALVPAYDADALG